MLSPYHRRSRRQFRREGQPSAPSGDVAGKNVYAFRRTARGATPPPPVRRGRAWRSFILSPFAKHYLDLRGLYRLFNAAEYRFYSKDGSPPDIDATDLLDSNPSLPHTPTDVFGNGDHHFRTTYFNGVIDSGARPVGPAGEDYLRIVISGGAQTSEPPQGPDPWSVIQRPGGVIRVTGYYLRTGDAGAGGAAGEWAIAYTTDGSTPPEDTPDVTQAMSFEGDVAELVKELDFSAEAHGTTIKVRLQTRRDDGSWVYSEASTVKTTTTDKEGPAAPAGEAWRGRLPEDF